MSRSNLVAECPVTAREQIAEPPKYPIGTDPEVMDRLLQIASDHRKAKHLMALIDGMGMGQRHVVQEQKRDRPNIFNNTVLKMFRPGEAKPQPAAVLRTEDGDELQLVDDEMPPDPNQEPIE